jgi:hypothetical protein
MPRGHLDAAEFDLFDDHAVAELAGGTRTLRFTLRPASETTG